MNGLALFLALCVPAQQPTSVKAESFAWHSDYWSMPDRAGYQGAVVRLVAKYSYRGDVNVALRECWLLIVQQVQDDDGVFDWDTFPLQVFVSVDRDAKTITIRMVDEP